MEDFIINLNKDQPVNIAILLVGAMEDVIREVISLGAESSRDKETKVFLIAFHKEVYRNIEYSLVRAESYEEAEVKLKLRWQKMHPTLDVSKYIFKNVTTE